jgi:N-acetylmuramate 1-kinase
VLFRSVVATYGRVIEAMIQWHSHDLSTASAVRQRRMDEEMFLWESSYFAAHCAVEFCGQEQVLDQHWEAERTRLAKETASLPAVCTHRDFQSENIMIHRDKVRFVDFQGARLGPAEYDLASLLFDPYVEALTKDIIDQLFTHYQSLAPGKVTLRSFHLAAAQRLLQALGAYGNLSLHKGKDWYRVHIPIALQRLLLVVERLHDFPAIHRVVKRCAESLR